MGCVNSKTSGEDYTQAIRSISPFFCVFPLAMFGMGALLGTAGKIANTVSNIATGGGGLTVTDHAVAGGEPHSFVVVQYDCKFP